MNGASDYLKFMVLMSVEHHNFGDSSLRINFWCIQDRIIIMASIIKANQLQDFGGNSILTSDGAGNLTTQKTNYPAFEAYLVQIKQYHATTIKFNLQTEIDTDNMLLIFTNYRFTPQ